MTVISTRATVAVSLVVVVKLACSRWGAVLARVGVVRVLVATWIFDRTWFEVWVDWAGSCQMMW